MLECSLRYKNQQKLRLRVMDLLRERQTVNVS